MCNQRLKELHQVVELYPGFVLTFSGLHLIFSVLATTGNILVIQALWKALSFPSNLKILFLSLAVTDLAIGLIPQPMLGIIFLLMAAMKEDGNFCPVVLNIGYFTFVLLVTNSFLIVTAISVDRLLAVSLHLRYQELVTPKRLWKVLWLIWLISLVTSIVFISFPHSNNVAPAAVEIIGLFFTSMAYIRIYKVVKYHQNRIQCQFEGPNVQTENLLREKKSAFSSLFVYIVLVMCYLPNLCTQIIILLATGAGITGILITEHVSLFLLLLNSSLNPVIYCWRCREIRIILKNKISNTLHFGSSN